MNWTFMVLGIDVSNSNSSGNTTEKNSKMTRKLVPGV